MNSDDVPIQAPRIESLRRHHRGMLGIAGAVMVLAVLLHARADQRVEFRFLPGLPLPESCGSRILFGIECPGCGLTRSLIALAAGDWDRCAGQHRLGWLLAAAVVIQIPYRLWALKHPRGLPLGEIVPRAFGMTLVVLLIGNWLVMRVLELWSGGH